MAAHSMTMKLTEVGIFKFATCTRMAVEPTHPPIPWVLGALRPGNKGVVPEMLWHFTFALCTSFHSAMLKTCQLCSMKFLPTVINL
jgi:hypothetical protein